MILVYPRKWGWPDLPHSGSNLSNSHSPCCSTQCILLLQNNTAALLLHLHFPFFLGRPRFLFPCTSNSNVFFITYPSSLLNTCLYHITPFTFEPLFPSIPTSPLGPLSSFSPSVLHNKLLLPGLSWSFSKFPSHFPSNTIIHSHITSPTSHNSDKLIPFILKENLFEFSNSPHSLNFTHPILTLAVTAVLQPPLAFTLSPK